MIFLRQMRENFGWRYRDRIVKTENMRCQMERFGNIFIFQEEYRE